jgi:hypothetical protein
MDDITRKPRVRPATRRNERPEDPAVAALTELIESERARVKLEEPDLAESADPGRVWLLWFAIGATEAVCRLVEREADHERNRVFREVVSVIFGGDGVRSGVDPVHADKTRIELFESAGAEAVEACMRGDKRLGYYLEALRVSRRRDL